LTQETKASACCYSPLHLISSAYFSPFCPFFGNLINKIFK
jgi:hypothetical protein